MNSKKFRNYMIIFNAIMGLLLFLSSEYILLFLRGKVIEGVNIFIDWGSPGPIGNYPPTGFPLPLPNLPFFVFLFTSIVNVVFIIKLRRSKE